MKRYENRIEVLGFGGITEELCDLSEGDLEHLGKLLSDGLQTDGAHHKQWYLEEIAGYLGYDVAHLRDCAQAGVAP